MREICTSGSMRGNDEAGQNPLVDSYSTVLVRAFDYENDYDYEARVPIDIA